MRKLAMILAAILTLNLTAPAASVYAAPVQSEEVGMAKEGIVYSEGTVSGNVSENEPTDQNGGTVSGNVSDNNPTDPDGTDESEKNPDVSGNEPSVSENEPSVSENEPSVSENDPSVSDNDPSVSENEPAEEILYVQDTYYKTSKGYPLVAAMELPIETTYNDMHMLSYFILSLKVSIDEGEAIELTPSMVQTALRGLPDPETNMYSAMTVGFNAGYDKDYGFAFTEGTHKLAYEMEFQYAGARYTVSGAKEVEFVDDSKVKESVAYETTSTQYMSANKGSKVRSIYLYYTVPIKGETINSFKFVNHDTQQAISYEVLNKNSYGGYATTDRRYTDMGGVSSWSLFNKDVYSASIYGDIQLKADIPEADYDVIFTTSKGRKIIMENAYRATKKAVVFNVDSTEVRYKNYTTVSTPIYSDNTGDYVSVFVYGLNLTKDNIPMFYADDKSEVLTEYLAEDKNCGYEEWENGFDFTVKKKDASREEWDSSRLFKVSGDAIYSSFYSIDEKELKYYCNGKSTKEYEWNTSAETFRIYLNGKNVEVDDVISVAVYKNWSETEPPTVQAKVQFDGSSYYIEFDKASIVYTAVKEHYSRLVYTIGTQEDALEYEMYIGYVEEPVVIKNITVPANHSWEVHSVKDVANVVYSGTTKTKKNVLTSEQVVRLEQNGLQRICIYNAKGKVVERYNAYFKGEELYNINYVLNGGENHPDNPLNYGKSDAITLLAPTKANHTFAGWYSDEKLTKKVTAISKGSTGAKTFYAKWTPYTYSIAYHANGGLGKMNATSCKYDVEASIAKNVFKRTGYVFVEWNTSADGKGTSYQEKEAVKNLASANKEVIKLYAIWEPITYNIVLDKNAVDAENGTVETDAKPIEVAYGDVFTLTGEEFVRTGYEITSWKTDAGKKIANGNVSNLTTISGNTVTLSAQWAVDNYTITYDYNGGKVKKTNPKSYTYNMASDIVFNVPQKAGYVFEGYYEVDQESVTVRPDQPAITGIKKGETGDKTLYAWWRPISYTVIFKDTTGATLKEGITEDSTKQIMQYGEVLTFTDSYYEKPGYTLVSWSTKQNQKGTKYVSGRGYSNLTTQDGAEIVVYANWKKDNYTITYQLDGGKNDKKNPKKYNVDSSITLKPASRKGYTFDGWYVVDTNGQMTEEKVEAITKGSTGNLILEAKWNPLTYDIVLDPNNHDYPAEGCIGTVHVGTYNYDQIFSPSRWSDLVAPSESWKNQGIGILYWSTKPNGSGTKYYPDKSYSALAMEGTVTLYAQWGLVPYAINYNYVGVEIEGIKNTNPTTYTYDTAKNITLKNITKAGYVFNGWYTDSSLADEYKLVDNKLSRKRCEDITLYASFTPVSYTIKLSPNGRDAVAKDNLVTEFLVEYGADYSLDADAYTKEHYQYTYWTTKANGKGTKVVNGTVNTPLSTENGAVITLYPKWELIPYTITYNNVSFEGEKVVNKNPVSYTYNAQKEVKLKNPTRTGYVFGGWYTENTTLEDFDAATAQKVTKLAKGTSGNQELYALWTPIRYKVQLDANAKDAKSGSVIIKGENEKAEISYGDSIYLQRDSYQRAGYNLVEFNTKKNGKGTSYALDENHKIYASKANVTVKLYAIWEKVTTKKVSGVELYAQDNQISVWFEKNEGCSAYEVAISKYFTMSDADTVITDSECVDFIDLEDATRYFVRVREIRYDSNGNAVNGAWSSLKSIKTEE